MSLNLWATYKDEIIKLWQTPTHITLMAMCQDQDDIPYNLVGKQARRALALYILWVDYTCDADQRANADEHIAYVRKFMARDISKLKVSIC